MPKLQWVSHSLHLLVHLYYSLANSKWVLQSFSWHLSNKLRLSSLNPTAYLCTSLCNYELVISVGRPGTNKLCHLPWFPPEYHSKGRDEGDNLTISHACCCLICLKCFEMHMVSKNLSSCMGSVFSFRAVYLKFTFQKQRKNLSVRKNKKQK